MAPAVRSIAENFHDIQDRIARAAQSSGRDGADVQLVVVTKAQPVEVVRAVVEAGAMILGENYPEETVPKMEALGRTEEVSWHMIGHLQSRKSGLVARHFDALQSLDSVRLAERLEKQLSEIDRILPVLLEVNVGGEESKHGWLGSDESAWPMLLPEVDKIISMRHIKLVGLMTMPPLSETPEDSRPYFVQLRKLGEFLSKQFGPGHFQEYSMGTSADFDIAVQEGASLVRIGQAIVGPRPQKTIG